MLRIVIATVLSLTLAAASPSGWAQNRNGKNNEVSTQGPKKHLTIIVFAGLAGAILGLSTLSFYGRPQDKLNNIALGAAVGIITGTIYSTFKAATEPRDFYNLREASEGKLFAMGDDRLAPPPVYSPKLNLTFSF